LWEQLFAKITKNPRTQTPITHVFFVCGCFAGSPLVILADGEDYWPIADTTPLRVRTTNWLPFAGQSHAARDVARGGSTAIVIEKISAEAAQK
jgi:hypothetical protein